MQDDSNVLNVDSSIDQLPDATNSQIFSGISQIEDESTIVKSQILNSLHEELKTNKEMDTGAKQENLSELLNHAELNKWEVGSEDIDQQFKENLQQSLN